MSHDPFCCLRLQNLVSVAGERGLSAVAVSSPEGLIFMLQSRGIEKHLPYYPPGL
jgi:hypothetical protein